MNSSPDSFEQKIALLIKFIGKFNHYQELDQFQTSFVELVCRIIQCEQALVYLFEAETNTLKIVACPPKYLDVYKLLRLPIERSFAGKVYYSGQSVVINPEDSSSVMDQDPVNVTLERRLGIQTRDLAIVPMVFRGETVGVLEARNKNHPGGFQGSDLLFLETLASIAAVTILSFVLFEEVEYAQNEVKKLEQLKADFIAITSHELRTPIGLILGHATFLEELIDDPELKYQMSVILRNTARLKEIVENFTHVSEYDVGASRLKRKPISMRRLIQRAAQDSHQQARHKNIRLELNIPENDLMVDADEEKILLVLNNLLQNALIFTDPGGQVLVEAKSLPGYVQISVSDTGIGIPAEDLHKVFDRFYQVQSHLTRKHGGLGLGLSVAKAMIELHKGQIWVESKEGQGSKFTFLLPTRVGTMERIHSLKK